MFTGLIETTGSVVSLTSADGAGRLIVAAPALSGRWRTGDSIAVNGVCLTALPAVDFDQRAPARTHFAADLATETLARTTLGGLRPGVTVNLELPTPAGSPLGGHVVQGHVDATATLISLVPTHPSDDETDWRLALELPPDLIENVIPQGSITVDGISLTVARLELPDAGRARVEIAIIPHTYKSTNLRTLTPGSSVNIETDVLAKYAAKQRPSSHETPWLTSEYLLANGY